MVSPLVRGLLGIEVGDAGRHLRFAPQLPADWDRLTVRRVAAAASRVDFGLERAAGRLTITETVTAGPAPASSLAPAFPLDARIHSVTVDGGAARFRAKAEGDVQRIEVDVPAGGAAPRRIVFAYDEGTDVFTRISVPDAGTASEGLRVLRSRVEGGALHLVVEGRAGRSYRIGVRTPRHLGNAPGVTVTPSPRGADLLVSFEGAGAQYVRRSIVLPLR